MNIQGIVGTLIAGTIGIYGISITVEKFNLDKIKSINEDFNIVLSQVDELKQNEKKLVNKYNELYSDANIKIEDAYSKLNDLSSSIEKKDKYISELEKKINDLNVSLEKEKQYKKEEFNNDNNLTQVKKPIDEDEKNNNEQEQKPEQDNTQSQDDFEVDDVNKLESDNEEVDL